MMVFFNVSPFKHGVILGPPMLVFGGVSLLADGWELKDLIQKRV